MILGIKFKMNESLYERDPHDTELGKKILKNSILLLDEIGLEEFTFKKLAYKIGSAEKSVYRYFPNKHLLLLFLTSWYWEWVHYLIQTNILNVEDSHRKLELAIRCIVKATAENSMTEYINENILHKVIINEGAKSYHTIKVDEENKAGLFLSYKNLVQTVVCIVKEINPDFKYAESLASNIFEMANNQIYFAQHIPKLTSLTNKIKKQEAELILMLGYFAEKVLAK